MDADLWELHVADVIGVRVECLGELNGSEVRVELAYRSGKALGEWATYHPWDEGLHHGR